MKVGIVGNYGNDNNGDEAILTGLIKQLTEFLPIEKEDIVVFSNYPDNTYTRYGLKAVPLYQKKNNILNIAYSTIVNSYKTMKELDVIIIGGGGLLMDLYQRGAPLYCTLGVMGKLAGCKVIIYGVGAGPINTAIGKMFLKTLVRVADSVSVRDLDSKNLLKSIGVKKEISVIGDPAFSLSSQSEIVKNNRVKNIGITAVPYYSKNYWPTPNEDKYKLYVDGMAKNIDRILEERKDVKITFYSTKYPQDVKVTEQIFEKLKYKKGVTVVTDNLHPEQLLELSSKQDIVIGTRLHSLILSVLTKTPIIGIGYHKKVKDFMKSIGQDQFCIDISKLTEADDQMLQLITQSEENWERNLEIFGGIAQSMHKEAEKGLIEIEKITGYSRTCNLKKGS